MFEGKLFSCAGVGGADWWLASHQRCSWLVPYHGRAWLDVLSLV